MSFSAICLVVLALTQSSPSDPAFPPQPESPPPTQPNVTATVNLDPEHPEAITGWWSNGKQLLEVDEDGAYRLFGSSNRYEKPIEVGRWHRQNHAAFWLEPYSARKEQRTRVPLSKLDTTTLVTVRNYEPMSHLETPPMVEEDFLIGMWAGEGGSLDLQPTMRYRFVAPMRPGESRPVVISSHRGIWRIRDGRVILTPDSPSVTTTSFEPARNDDGKPYMRLKGLEGSLERVMERKPAAPAEKKEEPAATPAPAAATPEATPAKN